MDQPFEHPRDVLRDEIDQLGHVGNVRYLQWLMDAAAAHSSALGFPWSAYEALGAAFVVRRHQLTYLRPAFAGDRVVVSTWVTKMGKASSTRAYRIHRGPDLLMEASTDWAFVELATGRPTRIPPPVSAVFVATDTV